ncbi:hypothetical protein DFH29DRAFT_367976 [Suillus ampliporus]|nr:hypothetical protein DFH29DRAFT_367976 [Suillus ampliporus]
MAPKFISFPVFAIFLLTCLSLLACASPIPIILPPSEGIALFRDVVAREGLPEVAILKRVATPALELHALVRDGDEGQTAEPSILIDDPDDGLEARICRYGCL